MNLRFFSKFNQNTVRWFQASFRRVLGVLVTWWCFVIFSDFSGVFSDFQKFTKHHQVTRTPKTLRKFVWNHLTVLWLNFERNWWFLFSTVQVLITGMQTKSEREFETKNGSFIWICRSTSEICHKKIWNKWKGGWPLGRSPKMTWWTITPCWLRSGGSGLQSGVLNLLYSF